MKKTFCDVTKDPNILEFVSMFAEQHDVVISFTFLGLAGFNVYMGKDGNLEFIMLPREELEIMDRHAMGSVLNDLLMRLETKEEYDKISYTPKEVRNILIKEGQEHGRRYDLKLGDTIKFSPIEVEKILKSESEE